MVEINGWNVGLNGIFKLNETENQQQETTETATPPEWMPSIFDEADEAALNLPSDTNGKQLKSYSDSDISSNKEGLKDILVEDFGITEENVDDYNAKIFKNDLVVFYKKDADAPQVGAITPDNKFINEVVGNDLLIKNNNQGISMNLFVKGNNNKYEGQDFENGDSDSGVDNVIFKGNQNTADNVESAIAVGEGNSLRATSTVKEATGYEKKEEGNFIAINPAKFGESDNTEFGASESSSSGSGSGSSSSTYKGKQYSATATSFEQKLPSGAQKYYDDGLEYVKYSSGDHGKLYTKATINETDEYYELSSDKTKVIIKEKQPMPEAETTLYVTNKDGEYKQLTQENYERAKEKNLQPFLKSNNLYIPVDIKLEDLQVSDSDKCSLKTTEEAVLPANNETEDIDQ